MKFTYANGVLTVSPSDVSDTLDILRMGDSFVIRSAKASKPMPMPT